MVLQDTWLFEGTIADNLGYAEDDMDRDKIIASAKSACAHAFIKALPGGYDIVYGGWGYQGSGKSRGTDGKEREICSPL